MLPRFEKDRCSRKSSSNKLSFGIEVVIEKGVSVDVDGEVADGFMLGFPRLPEPPAPALSLLDMVIVVGAFAEACDKSVLDV